MSDDRSKGQATTGSAVVGLDERLRRYKERISAASPTDERDVIGSIGIGSTSRQRSKPTVKLTPSFVESTAVTVRIGPKSGDAVVSVNRAKARAALKTLGRELGSPTLKK